MLHHNHTWQPMRYEEEARRTTITMFHGNNTTRKKSEEQQLASTSLFQGLLEPPEGVGASGLEASEIFEGREARKRKMVEQGEQVAMFLICNIFLPPDPPGGR